MISREEFRSAVQAHAAELVPHLHRLLNASLAFEQNPELSLFLELLGRIAESVSRGDYPDARARFRLALALIPKDSFGRYSP